MLINLTPHNINLITDKGGVVIKSSGVARCSQEDILIGSVDGGIPSIPIYKTMYGEVIGLPDKEVEGTYYIVSLLVANALRGKRNDLLVVAKTIRNNEGQIVGCKGFARI